jgi:hypothetical protein
MEMPKLNKVIAIVGDRGSYKSCFATSLAYSYTKNKINVFSNMDFFNINYKKIDFKDVSTFPDYLENGVIIMDEMHVGADAYNFLKGDVRNITQFITQIRKRNLSFIYITQNFRTVVSRLRQQTDYVFIMAKSSKEDHANIEVRDMKDGYKLVNLISDFNGKPFYPLYNTNQIIE